MIHFCLQTTFQVLPSSIIEQNGIQFILQVQLVDKGSVVDGTIPWMLVLPYFSQLIP